MWKIFKRRAATERQSVPPLDPPLIITCFTESDQKTHLGVNDTWTTLCSHEYVKAGHLVLASEVGDSVGKQNSISCYCPECVEILTGIPAARILTAKKL